MIPYNPANTRPYPTSVQVILKWYAFFMAFPVIDILGLSITFYIFMILSAVFLKHNLPLIKQYRDNIWFFLFLVFGIISLLGAPPLITEVSPGMTLKSIIQLIYWVLLAVFFKTNFKLINWHIVSKYLFWGLVCLIFVYYFVRIEYNSPLMVINFAQSRNGVIFNVLTFFPLTFFYLMNSKLRKPVWLIILIFIISVIFFNGRSGFILIILQSLLIGVVIARHSEKLFRIAIFGMLALIVIWNTMDDNPLMDQLASGVEAFNPRAAALIQKTGTEGDLSYDKSWLLRKLMVTKALEIAQDYPFFGIGLFNFSRYDSKLMSLSEFERLKSMDNFYYNTRSAHNSYAEYLAEGGFIGITLLLIILITAIWPLIKKFFFGGFTFDDLPRIALFTLMIYFWAISALMGAGTWFIIGTAFTLSGRKDQKTMPK